MLKARTTLTPKERLTTACIDRAHNGQVVDVCEGMWAVDLFFQKFVLFYMHSEARPVE
jgi:hypothetical protein